MDLVFLNLFALTFTTELLTCTLNLDVQFIPVPSPRLDLDVRCRQEGGVRGGGGGGATLRATLRALYVHSWNPP